MFAKNQTDKSKKNTNLAPNLPAHDFSNRASRDTNHIARWIFYKLSRRRFRSPKHKTLFVILGSSIKTDTEYQRVPAFDIALQKLPDPW